MRIGVDARALIDGRRSGVAVYSANIIRALVAASPHHEWHLFFNSFHNQVGPNIKGDKVQWHTFSYPNSLLNLSQSFFKWPRWDQFIKVDCFFAPNLSLLPLHPEMPLVATVHDLSYEYFPRFFSPKMRLWHWLIDPANFLRRATHLIAVSQATATDLREKYQLSPEKISIVYSGVTAPPPLSEEKKLQIQDYYHLPEHFVLYLGTLEPRKNVASLIRAFDSVAGRIGHHLVIAGSKGWLTTTVDQALKESKFKNKIHFIGFVEEENKPALYALADLFVYPSFYEGFGFPPLEALLAGTPVITSHQPALPEIVGEWAAMIDPYNVSELALVMEDFLTAPTRVDPTVPKVILKRFSWQIAAKKTLSILEKAYEDRH